MCQITFSFWRRHSLASLFNSFTETKWINVTFVARSKYKKMCFFSRVRKPVNHHQLLVTPDQVRQCYIKDNREQKSTKGFRFWSIWIWVIYEGIISPAFLRSLKAGLNLEGHWSATVQIQWIQWYKLVFKLFVPSTKKQRKDQTKRTRETDGSNHLKWL